MLPAGSRTALSPTGDVLLVTGTNGIYHLWETGLFKESPPYPLPLQDADIWAVSTGGVRVAMGNKSGVLVVGEPVSGRVNRSSAGQAGPLQGLVFSRDGQLLADADADGTIIIWDAASGAQRARWERDPGEWSGLKLAFSPDGRVLARAWSSSFAGLLETMDVTTGQPQRRLPVRQRAISAVAITPDNQGAITASYDGNIMIWDLASGRKRAELTGELMSYSSLALSADGRRLAAYGAQGTVTLWDAALTQPLQVAMFPQVAGWHGSLEMAFSLDGNTLVAADSYTLWVWQAPSLAAIEATENRAEAKAQ
jgi:WD40 repeat protein